jgi:hypothetical protein
MESICAEEDVPKCNFFIPQFDVVERKQFGRSAAQASRPFSAPLQTVSLDSPSSSIVVRVWSVPLCD